MPDQAKTVFVSYRRSLSSGTARSIFQALKGQDYDVFMDVESLDSGTFDTIIMRQIAARMHFILVLQPGSLDRTSEPDDWLRREVEEAIRLKRNIVPILADGFAFDTTNESLPGKLKQLPRYNGLNLYHDYFDEAIDKLTTRFLKPQTDIELQPLPAREQQATTQQMSKVDAPRLRQLSAPKLVLKADFAPYQISGLTKDTLTWQPVDGATRYILQSSTDRAFLLAQEQYKGAETTVAVKRLSGSGRFYRVKAQGVNLVADSAWSNVVQPSFSFLDGSARRIPKAKTEVSGVTGPPASAGQDAPTEQGGDSWVAGFVRIGIFAIVMLFFSVLSTLALGWLAGWVFEWVFDRFGWSPSISAPGWLLPATGVLWGILYTVGWSFVDSFAEAIFGPYSSAFDEYQEPDLLGSLFSAFPLSLILPYLIALVLTSAVTWVGAQGIVMVGWSPILVPPAPVFWGTYGVLLLWGIVGYFRGALGDSGWA